MKSTFNALLTLLFCFLAFKSSAQYSFTGKNVYPVNPFNSIMPKLAYDIDESTHINIVIDTLTQQYKYLLLDTSYAIVFQDYLPNLYKPDNYPNHSLCGFTNDDQGYFYLGFIAHDMDSLFFYKIDTYSGALLYDTYTSIDSSFQLGFGTFTASQTTGELLTVLTYEHKRKPYSILIDNSGAILNQQFAVLPDTNFYTLYQSPIASDADLNFYVFADYSEDFDLTSTYCPGDDFKFTKYLWKFDKNGNLVFNSTLPYNRTTTDISFTDLDNLYLKGDTVFAAGYWNHDVISNCGSNLISKPILIAYDATGTLLNSFIEPNDSLQTGDATEYGEHPYKYLGEGINGQVAFLYEVIDENLTAYYSNSNPSIVLFDLATLQPTIVIPIMQYIDPTIPFNLMDGTNVYKFIVDPSGNYSIFCQGDYYTSNFDYLTTRCYLWMDPSGNVLQVDTFSDFIIPTYWNTTLFNNNLNIQSTIISSYNPYRFYTANWCFGCSPSVTGRVYMDSLMDCADASDPAFPLHLLSIDSGITYTFSDPNGYYNAFLDSGPHTIEPVQQANDYWYVSCATMPLAVNAPAAPNVSTGNDIAIEVLPNVHDIKSELANSCARPGFSFSLFAQTLNKGSMIESGIAELFYDDTLFTYFSSYTSPDSISAGYLAWNYQNLPILFGEDHFGIFFTVPSTIPIGTPYSFTWQGGNVSTDTTPANNVFVLNDTVNGSYDPNDKQVWPKGDGPQGYITLQDSVLSYLIRFQNTGTDTAFTVKVTDMIDEDLDMSTLQIGVASHPYTVQLDGRKLTFTFNNILLPFSGTNEVMSHGLIAYTINQKPGLPSGTEITNTAEIYFDFNAAVVTNSVLNTVTWPVGNTESDFNNKTNFISAHPNPFNGSLQLTWNCTEPIHSLTLWNLQGQKVGDFTSLTKGNLSGKVDLGTQSTSLPNGIYFLKAETETSLKMLKVVKQ